jgi:hypothetical protein
MDTQGEVVLFRIYDLSSISRRWDVGMWTGLGWPKTGQVADACECGNEPSGSIKMRGIS